VREGSGEFNVCKCKTSRNAATAGLRASCRAQNGQVQRPQLMMPRLLLHTRAGKQVGGFTTAAVGNTCRRLRCSPYDRRGARRSPEEGASPPPLAATVCVRAGGGDVEDVTTLSRHVASPQGG
jgi:hypothetical protein